MILNADQLERFIELLQVINKQVSPWAIHSLLLANDSLFKIETALAPSEDLGHRGLANDRTEYRMSH